MHTNFIQLYFSYRGTQMSHICVNKNVEKNHEKDV